jgi:hypothetical protein
MPLKRACPGLGDVPVVCRSVPGSAGRAGCLRGREQVVGAGQQLAGNRDGCDSDSSMTAFNGLTKPTAKLSYFIHMTLEPARRWAAGRRTEHGPGPIPCHLGPTGKVDASGQGVRMLGAQDSVVDGQQGGVLVACAAPCCYREAIDRV